MILLSVGPSMAYTIDLAKEICPYSGPPIDAYDDDASLHYMKRLIHSANVVSVTKSKSIVANDDIAVHFGVGPESASDIILLSFISMAHYSGLQYTLHTRVVLDEIDKIVDREFKRKFKVHYE